MLNVLIALRQWYQKIRLDELFLGIPKNIPLHLTAFAKKGKQKFRSGELNTADPVRELQNGMMPALAVSV
jgi:hypothetical protein